MQVSKYTFRLLAVTVLVALSLIIACGGGDDEGENGMNSQGGPPPVELVDTWTFQSVTVNGSPATLDSVMEWVTGAVAARFTIGSGNQYSYEEINSVGGQLFYEIGFVVVEGNEIDVVLTANSGGAVNESFSVTFIVSGSTLTITLIEGADTIVFTLTN